MHGSTYGGNALGCAVALSVVNILATPSTRANIAARTDQLRTGMVALNDKYALFTDIRASGLWFGCELIPKWHGRAKEFVKMAEKHGLMILVAGTNIIRLAPSLLITAEDIDLGLKRFDTVFAEILAIEAAAIPAAVAVA